MGKSHKVIGHHTQNINTHVYLPTLISAVPSELNLVAHGPSAESTVNNNNTIFHITKHLAFIMTLFD